MDSITKQKGFWSEDDDQVLKAIREGFLVTQQAMWKDQPNWSLTNSGYLSTAGTTASICFIKRGKIFVGHCGDSGIVLGEKDPNSRDSWRPRPLTIDHKPESKEELKRITDAGGKVVVKAGVPRVVWRRPRDRSHRGPVRRSTEIDELPFLAVARALGDLWSYNAADDVFVVSPDPDLYVHEIDVTKDRCLVLATDGAWNVLSAEDAVESVFNTERHNEEHMLDPDRGPAWVNPSKRLVDNAINRWKTCNLRADNTSIVTVMLDPPGPPRAQVLRKRHAQHHSLRPATLSISSPPPKLPPKPSATKNGIAIISRFPNSNDRGEKHGHNLVGGANGVTSDSRLNKVSQREEPASPVVNRIVHDSIKTSAKKVRVKTLSTESDDMIRNIKEHKSPSPPPLPARPPGGLASKQSLAVALSKAARASRPLRSQNTLGLPKASTTDGEASSRPILRRSHKEVADRIAGRRHEVPPRPAPALPVKQPRRSTAPEPLLGSDAENEPVAVRRVHSPLKARMATRRSLLVDKCVSKTHIQRGRRSDPVVVVANLSGDSSASESLPPRVLRPKNRQNDEVATMAAAGDATSSCGKRKRRSSGVARDGPALGPKSRSAVVGDRPRLLNAKAALDAASAAKKARLLSKRK